MDRVAVTERNGMLSVAWHIEDYERFDRVKESFKAAFPHNMGRRYDPTSREWTIPNTSKKRLARWLASWCSPNDVDWDEWPRLYRELHAEREQPPPRQERQAPSGGPYSELFVVAGAPRCVVEAAYRALLKVKHPDVGGSHEETVKLTAAVEAIRKERSWA